ncbi:response regulator [Sandaracinus amylolyticus]|uniref:response regulator n=1 Tax=Sandaracinus amylolyticus TaxID=927083 RepID=UPI001F001CD7|nr:response regulator [Sandaracinus amylolyticus]UJR80607.1 Chemotaxis protein methyltransferase CheR [Sandaracinus amylolyticus]
MSEAETSAPALRRVLIVEDNDDVREMIRLYFEHAGLEVLQAADGRGGLELALRERPDLVLMDLGLPELDGFTLARAIRAEDPERRMRLVAMSGYAREHLGERAEPGLLDRWLLKPVMPDVLLQLVRHG